MPNSAQLVPLWVRFATGEKLTGLNALSLLYLRTQDTDYGGGDFGSLYKLIDITRENGLSSIQLLPLFDTAEYSSPYMPVSFFALNPIYLWVDDPLFEGLGEKLRQEQIQWVDQQIPQYVLYGKLRQFKLDVLNLAYGKLKTIPEFETYKKECRRDTRTWAEFCAFKETHTGDWQKWPKTTGTNSKRVDFYLFVQWILGRQLQYIKQYAEQRGVYICLDRPLYPQVQSSDAWSRQELFYLKPDGYPQYVSGCSNPQDPFGDQVWGHAVYDFNTHEPKIRSWFEDSIEYMVQFCDAVRLDHVLALIWKYYLIDPQTSRGEHRVAQGRRLLEDLVCKFPHTFFIAEETGYESEEAVDKPLREIGMSGVRCIQWTTERNYDVLSYPRASVAYTSTHDSQPLVTWFSQKRQTDKSLWLQKIRAPSSISAFQLRTSLIHSVLTSPAQLCMINIMDILGDTRRLNTPATSDADNWKLRMLRPLEKVKYGSITNHSSSVNTSGADPQSAYMTPSYPRVLHLDNNSNFSFYIASKNKFEYIQIHTNLPEISKDKKWSVTTIHASEIKPIKMGDYYIWNISISKTSLTVPGTYELAVSIKYENGEYTYLQSMGKNLKINIL